MVKVLDKGFIELEDHMGDDNAVVSAARVSHLGESKGTEKDTELIRYLLENGHTSPFEHVQFKFMVKCPIFVARQWMRHRTWSYNETSRRYTSENIEFHIPEELRQQSPANKQSSLDAINKQISDDGIAVISEVTSLALNSYEYLLQLGIAREQARMVLPTNLYTSFYGTIDLHNLFHFLELRNDSHTQKETRMYAEAIETLIEPIVPISYKIWKELKHGKGK